VGGKEAAARKAVEYVKEGMTLGIGTGSTAMFAIQALGERIQRDGLRIRAVPTSQKSRELVASVLIPLADLSDVGIGLLDLTIDGADEVDTQLNLIKGGGGALLREKIVASASREMIVICDDSKCKPHLGAHPLPVAVAPFGFEATHRQLRRFSETALLRRNSDGSIYVTDDSLYIFDLYMKLIENPAGLEEQLKRIVGVMEVGLFVNIASKVVVGYEDGRTEILSPPRPVASS